MSPFELVLAAGALVVALGAIGGAFLWLVMPRFRDTIEDVVEAKVGRVENKLEDRPDTVGRHARVAAAAASRIPQLEQDVAAVLSRVAGLDEWKERTERRLTSVEGALLALLGPELRKRLVEDLDEQTTYQQSERKHS